MRLLFKFAFLTILVLSVYYTLAQNETGSKPVAEAKHWVKIRNQSGLSINFPDKPAQLSSVRQIDGLGQVRINSYQVQQQEQLYVMLVIRPHQKIEHRSLQQLTQQIHYLNDTRKFKIRDEHYFSYQGLPTYTYRARGNKGLQLWCRTIHTGHALLSLIYAQKSSRFDDSAAKQFFNGLNIKQ